MSQAELASHLGTSRTRLNSYLTGKVSVSEVILASGALLHTRFVSLRSLNERGRERDAASRTSTEPCTRSSLVGSLG